MSDKTQEFVGVNWLRGAAAECKDDGAPWSASWCFNRSADTIERQAALIEQLTADKAELTASRDRHERDVDVFRQRWIEKCAEVEAGKERTLTLLNGKAPCFVCGKEFHGNSPCPVVRDPCD